MATFIFVFCLPFFAFSKQKYEPKIGDILFQDLDCGDFCDAIEKVTEGRNGKEFSHMGILNQNPSGEWVVYEANGQGVVATSYEKFIFRSVDEKKRPKILVTRLKKRYQNAIPQVIDFINEKLGKVKYDPIFDFENDRYYCSEMIYFAFIKTKYGKTVFTAKPMTFKDPDTGEFFPAWVEHYKRLQTKIPEGKLGINPGIMSQSRALKVVYDFQN